jgi:glycogen debranching enzyme
MLPLAGLPDHHTSTARDALLAALQSLALDPTYAADVLRALTRHDPALDLNALDARAGGSAGLPQRMEIAPLWVALLAETLDWTGDLALFEELLPLARRTMRLMERRSEALGPHDASLQPLVYTYLARRALARTLRRRGSPHDHAEIAALELGAESLRQHIERDFWLGDVGCYARALDDLGQPLRAVTSASAHALWARMATGPRAARIAARLTQPDLASGWGLRTRSADDPRYDALDPCHGAVWTHETALAAIGLLRAGHATAGLRLAHSVFAVAAAQLDARLPAYIGGQHQYGAYASAPRWCAEASMPSAAAVASPIALIAAMLGCEPDALAGRLTLRPVLPVWLPRVSLRHLRVGTARIDIEASRAGPDGVCEVSAQVTSGECSVLVQPPTRAYA